MYTPNLKSVALAVPDEIREVAKLQTPNLEEGEALGGRDGTVRKSVGEFLFACYSNVSSIFTRFRDIAAFVLKNAIFSTPTTSLVSQKFPHVPLGSPFGCKERRCWANCPCN